MIKTLEGIKIVDFTVAGSGPSVTRLLAEYGAEVCMIEPLGGVNTRTFLPETDYYDTGDKKSLPVNLKAPEGQKIMLRLLKEADVFVTNYRLKAIRKLGFDYETVHALNPRLIYATLTGYGSEGPEKDSPGYDFVSYWSEAGLLNSISDSEGAVLVPLTGYGDPICGKTLAMGICAALYRRETGGGGMEITTSLLADGVYQNHTPIIETQYGGSWPKTRKRPDSALKNTYRCRDGWFYLCADDPVYFAGIFHAANLLNHVDDPAYRTMEDAAGEKGRALTALLDEAFSTFYTDGAIAALQRCGVPCYKVASQFEAIEDRQANENQYWQENVQASDGRRIMVQSSPVRFGDNVPAPYTPVPRLGENTRQLLGALGYSQAEIAELVEKKIVVAE